MKNVICARDLHKTYRSQTPGVQKIKALDGLSLDVKEGEILGILGPNGAGKTTFLNTLSTLLVADQGTVHILGVPLIEKNFNHIRRRINLSSGYPNFPWSLTVEENLRFYGRLYGLAGKKLVHKVQELIESFKLEHCFRQRFDELSSGNKQRLSLAKAFLNDPQILFLDEPTVGLDPDASVHTRQIISNVIKDKKVTVLLTTHNMAEAELMCQRVAFIKQGRILRLASPQELRQSYGNKSLEEVFVQLAGDKSAEGNAAFSATDMLQSCEMNVPLKSQMSLERSSQWFNRTFAFCFRNYLFTVRNVFTVAELIFWPMVTLLSIGLLGNFLSVGEDAMAFILTGAIAGGILQVAQLDVAYSLLYEVWSKSIKHLFLTPIGNSEYLFGSWLIGVLRASILFGILGISAIKMFGFVFPPLHVTLIFLLGIFTAAILQGLLVSFLVLIYGQKAEITAWMFAYVAMLLSGIYYPIDTLPPFFAELAKCSSLTYFLEYYRQYFGFESQLTHLLIKGFGLTSLYLAAGIFMLKWALAIARKKRYLDPSIGIISGRAIPMNLRIVLLLIIVTSSVQVNQSNAEVFFPGNNKILNLRGKLVDINFKYHHVTVEDEVTKLTRRFYVFSKPIDQLQVDDEVRIYYYPGSREAVSIKKMTAVEYRKEDQNKGYLIRSQ